MSNSLTLQDMPDDILEIIYKNLDMFETTNTNIALCKRIKTSKETYINSRKTFRLIPEYYHKYINVCTVNQDGLDTIYNRKNIYSLNISGYIKPIILRFIFILFLSKSSVNLTYPLILVSNTAIAYIGLFVIILYA
jgi:hypothetical protein